jgi:hypothetical protein
MLGSHFRFSHRFHDPVARRSLVRAKFCNACDAMIGISQHFPENTSKQESQTICLPLP